MSEAYTIWLMGTEKLESCEGNLGMGLEGGTIRWGELGRSGASVERSSLQRQDLPSSSYLCLWTTFARVRLSWITVPAHGLPRFD